LNYTDNGASDATLYTVNTESNDYVSWGYWETVDMLDDDNNSIALENNDNLWVAGKNAVEAATFISNLIEDSTTTTYAYSGKALGYVLDANDNKYTMDSANSDVYLEFDFGGGSGSLKDTSYIKFTANSENWELKDFGSGSVNSGKFSDTGSVYIGNDSISNSESAFQGRFYGDEAQAVGGAFNATANGEKAIGVFKATR